MLDDEGTLTPGTVIGGEYEVVRELARGGMGALYVARHRGSDQLRALKTMHARYVTDPMMRARFAREARVSAQVASDHAVEVFGAGVDDTLNIPWMAMELLDGEDLSRLVERRGPMSPAETAAVMAQLGHCLGAAHRAGIVHRDLKPANVFLAVSRRQGDAFTVKVLDFGIAKFLNLATGNATTSSIGSPLWMAPGQTNPETPISPATDVWALALLAFFLLTGRVFWMTPTYANANVAALLGELLMLPLPSASARAAELGVDGRIPGAFDEWFARCLSRDAAARFADASAAVPPLVALLQRAASAPVVAPAPTRPDVHVPPTVAMPVVTPAGPATQAPVAPAAPTRSRPATVAVVGVAALLTVALAAAGVSAFRHAHGDRHPVAVAHPVAAHPVAAHPVAAPPVAAAPVAAAPPPPPPAPSVVPPTLPPVVAPSRSRRSGERASRGAPTPAPAVFTLPSLAPPSDDDRARRRRRRERRDDHPGSPFGVFRPLH